MPNGPSIQREAGEPEGRNLTTPDMPDTSRPGGTDPDAEGSFPPDTGIGTRGKGADTDEDARDWDEEEAVRTGEIATEP